MQFDDIVQSHPVVLVDFYADWCGPCKMMVPVLKNIKEKFGENIKVVKIDVDKNPAIAARFQIKNLPTLSVFKDGHEARKMIGALTENELSQILKYYL